MPFDQPSEAVWTVCQVACDACSKCGADVSTDEGIAAVKAIAEEMDKAAKTFCRL